MKRIIIVITLITICVAVKAQKVIEGYIINIEGNKAYLDVTSPKVEIGNVLSVYSDAGYIIHPVTKKKIKKEGRIIADLEVVEVNNEYSVVTIYPEEAIKKLKTGMIAQMPELTPEMKEAIEKEQEAISEAQANEIEAASNNPENFTTAEQVIQWHLKSTGLDKMAANPPQSYLIETKVTTTNKKGKEMSVVYLTRIVDISTQRIYTKVDIKINKIKATSSSVVSNGFGWLKEGKKKPKQLDNDKVRNLIENVDIIKDLTCQGYTYTLCGDLVLYGKSCFELDCSYPGKNRGAKSYIDKKTGLLVATRKACDFTKIGILKAKVEKTTVIEKVIGYNQYGDYLLPSSTQGELENGFYIETELLQFIPNYPVNDSQFTKEALTGNK